MPTTERPGGQEVMRIGPPPRRGRLVVVIIACVVLLLGGMAWWRHDRTPLAPSTSSSPALPPTSVRLATGKATPTGARLPHHAPVAIHGQGAAVWSPDGKWLFVIDANRTIKAIDAHTGHARSLRLRLPNGDQTIQQIAVRP